MNCTRLATIELGAYNLYGKIGTEKMENNLVVCAESCIFVC